MENNNSTRNPMTRIFALWCAMAALILWAVNYIEVTYNLSQITGAIVLATSCLAFLGSFYLAAEIDCRLDERSSKKHRTPAIAI